VAEAARLFLTPPQGGPRARDRDFLAGGEGFVVRVGEARLAAWRFGAHDRPAVILSHGWGGRGAQLRAFVPALEAAGFQAVVFDHAGHGHSEGRQSSLVDFARGLAAVAQALDARGIAVAGVIGHSLGAAAIAPFLRASGRRLRAVLVAPPSSLVGYSAWFAKTLGLGERLRARLQRTVERRYGVRWEELELPRAVAGLDAPALVIHDGDDREVRLRSGLAVARAWPGARFVRTAGLGHHAILRDAGVVRDAVDFLGGEVAFPRPPAPDEWSAFPGPAPIL
jgi:pimeloyl-ACP methyl ester carboxylesterase